MLCVTCSAWVVPEEQRKQMNLDLKPNQMQQQKRQQAVGDSKVANPQQEKNASKTQICNLAVDTLMKKIQQCSIQLSETEDAICGDSFKLLEFISRATSTIASIQEVQKKGQ